MTVLLYMDHHVPKAITVGLRLRGVDVILLHKEREHRMQEKITIALPQKIRTALDVVLAEEGKSANDLIGQAVADYLFFRELRLLQERLTAKAQMRGIFNEEEIFNLVS